MRRPRAGLVTPLPGGPDQPAGPTTRVCPQGLDDGAERWRAEALRARRPKATPRSAPGSSGAGDRKAAVERREAPALPQGARHDRIRTRFAALHSLGIVRENERRRRPRAAKNRGGGALAKPQRKRRNLCPGSCKTTSPPSPAPAPALAAASRSAMPVRAQRSPCSISMKRRRKRPPPTSKPKATRRKASRSTSPTATLASPSPQNRSPTKSAPSPSS